MTFLPTPARLALLLDVADGQVCYSRYHGTVLDLACNPPRTVIAETAELRHAGWITVDLAVNTLGSSYYELTEVGRKLLDAHEHATGGSR